MLHLSPVNAFFMATVRDDDNNIVNYVGVQCVVDETLAASHLSKHAVRQAREQASSLYPEFNSEL
jgi:hypothetical protein